MPSFKGKQAKEDRVFLWRNLTSTAIASAAAALLRTRPAVKPQAKPAAPAKTDTPATKG